MNLEQLFVRDRQKVRQVYIFSYYNQNKSSLLHQIWKKTMKKIVFLI